MSQENVEIVGQHIAAFQVLDVPRTLSFLDPYIVLDMSRVGGGPASDAVYGLKAVDEFMRSYVGAFEGYRYEAERLTDLGSGAVLAVVTETGRGRNSGVPVHRFYAVIYNVLDGKIARMTMFAGEEEAREAAGLSE